MRNESLLSKTLPNVVMACFSLSNWLEQIDPCMKEYATKLETFGFGSLKTLRNIDGEDINSYFPEMLPGHKKALLGEARKLRTPVKGAVVDLTTTTSSEESGKPKRHRYLDFSAKSDCSNTNNSNNSNLSIVVNSTATNDIKRSNETSNEIDSNAKKPRLEPRQPPKTVSDKEENLVMELSKLEAEIERKQEDINMHMIPVEPLPTMGKMNSICSVCHRKGHRAEGNKDKQDCILDRCQSYFICGQKSKHPEHAKLLAKERKELTNLRQSLGKVQEQLNMLRQFVNKTSETNFMLEMKRRLRMTDSKKYRDVAVLLRDVRALKVSYKGKIPPVDQDDSQEFPKLLKQLRHKVKGDTGDFNLSSDDSDGDNFENQIVSIKQPREESLNLLKKGSDSQTATAQNSNQFWNPSTQFPWQPQGNMLFPNVMYSPQLVQQDVPQQPIQWFPQQFPYNHFYNQSTYFPSSAAMSATATYLGPPQNVNSAMSSSNDSLDEISGLTGLPDEFDLEDYLLSDN